MKTLRFIIFATVILSVAFSGTAVNNAEDTVVKANTAAYQRRVDKQMRLWQN